MKLGPYCSLGGLLSKQGAQIESLCADRALVQLDASDPDTLLRLSFLANLYEGIDVIEESRCGEQTLQFISLRAESQRAQEFVLSHSNSALQVYQAIKQHLSGLAQCFTAANPGTDASRAYADLVAINLPRCELLAQVVASLMRLIRADSDQGHQEGEPHTLQQVYELGTKGAPELAKVLQSVQLSLAVTELDGAKGAATHEFRVKGSSYATIRLLRASQQFYQPLAHSFPLALVEGEALFEYLRFAREFCLRQDHLLS